MNISAHRYTAALIAAVACLAAARATGGAPADRQVWLASLDLSVVHQGWGKPMADRSVDGHALKIGGRAFDHGLGTHSTGEFEIDLAGGSRRFTAWVGIDDETAGKGSVEFEVVADGRLLFSSGVMHGGQAPKHVDVDLKGARHLALLVGDAGDGFEFDHADWADASFEVTGDAPRSARPEVSNPTISMSFPIGPPHITSPLRFGVRPGTPLLYTVTAAGSAPITYSATGLPAGVKLDSATGVITGATPRSEDAPQIYSVQIRAANALGSDTKKLTVAVGDGIALTPPLGWNSYDCFGDDVTEAEVLANARYLKENLQPHGWEYVVVDYRWYDPLASKAPNDANVHQGQGLTMDGFGRLLPAPNRFPSAADGKGFKPLADMMHGMGLKFGIHVMRGITRQAVKDNAPIEGSAFHARDAANTNNTCPWCSDMYGVDAGKPAGQAWYDSLLRLYAGWGVDYIKVDDMSSPYSTLEIEAVHRAIARCGRDIVLSLSPGETPIDDAQNVQIQANLWRISGDFWDNWGAVSHQFDLISRWKGYGGPGHWPDADMIPLGHLSVGGRSVGPDRRTALTKDEQMTLISLWSLAPSPMMLGMNLPDNDPWTLALLTNDEVLAVNQDVLGAQAVRLPSATAYTGVEIWVRSMADGSKVAGLFNMLGVRRPVKVAWSQLGLAGVKRARDLWQRRDAPIRADGYEAEIGPHGAALLRLTPQ